VALKKLEKSEWRPFFDHLSKQLEGKQAKIEVAGLSLGDQIQAKWVPVYGIVYDHKGDLMEIALEGLDHLIRKPREITLDLGTAGPASIEIIDEEGVKQIVKLNQPLMLPHLNAGAD
jgi:hypothetical protein